MNHIEGIIIKQLKRINNERGSLLEIQHRNDDLFIGFGQSYATETNPYVIKGWYLHHKQIDQIIVLKGCIKLVLYDVRPGSLSIGTIQEIMISANNSCLIQIPPGVWHSFQAFSNEILLLLHLNSEPYDFNHPDEDRLNINNNLIPYHW